MAAGGGTPAAFAFLLMLTTLERFEPAVYAVLRMVLGFLYLVHGLQKMFGLFGGQVMPVTSMLGVAGVIEVVAGLAIVVGLWTRGAALVASGEMAAAYFLAHLPRGLWPVQNGGEPAVLLCFGFLYIAARGAGAWSADAIRAPRRSY